MTGAVVDVPVASAEPSFFRLLWRVLLGYVCGLITLGALYVPLYLLGFVPSPFLYSGPFPVDDAWSAGADVFAMVAIVLVSASWIYLWIPDKGRRPVSFGVVAAVVLVMGYATGVMPLAVVFTVPATAWLVRRYAVGRTLPFARPSRLVWIVLVLVLALVGVVVVGSYRVYHPLVAQGVPQGAVDLWNPGWADLTITHVEGGGVDSPGGNRERLPYTVPARSHVTVWAFDHVGDCVNHVVHITFSVLGRTSTQDFTVLAANCLA